MRSAMRTLATLAFAALAACDGVLPTTTTSTTTTTTLTPVTGLRVQASVLIDPLGCGTGTSDAYRWGGVVRAKGSTTPIAARAVDCFADLVFHELPPTGAPVDTYEIALVAFTAPGWDGLPEEQRAGLVAGKPEAFGSGGARWTSTCTGVQERGFRRDAVCKPFESFAP